MSEEGTRIRRLAQGAKAPQLAAALEALDPDALAWSDDFIFGQVWTREGLEFEERMLVAISMLAALGQIPQLRNYLFGAVEAGIAEAKIQDTLAMTSVYAGFPAALNALECWRLVRASPAEDPDEGERPPGGESP